MLTKNFHFRSCVVKINSEVNFMITNDILCFSDINECQQDRFLCDGGQCRNTPGSYQCICPIGLKLNRNTKACEGWYQAQSSEGAEGGGGMDNRSQNDNLLYTICSE